MSLSASLLLSVLASPLARAGSGPWVIGEGQTDVYVGTEARRLEKLAISTGSFAEEDLIEVDEGLSAFGAKLILTHGVLTNVEVDLSLPWTYVHANRDDGPVCAALGLQACETTRGVGVITARARYNALNELYGPPLSLTVGLEARHGDLTSGTRARITNLGEGTFDLGPVLSLGRTGGLGNRGYWYSFLDAGYRYRFPNVEEGVTQVPGSELFAEADWVAVPDGRVGFGPVLTFFWRPEGQDVEDLLAEFATDIDRLGRLRVLAAGAGGKLTVRSSRKVSFSLSALRTVYAVNNPLVLNVNLGLTVNDVGNKGS